MTKPLKLQSEITPRDFESDPVWEYVRNADDELAMSPVSDLPVKSLDGRVVGTQLHLACGLKVEGALFNVDCRDGDWTSHVLLVSVFRNGEWFHLSRYHDLDRSTFGPDALAHFLQLTVPEVFPIRYDISRVAEGDPAALTGEIPKEHPWPRLRSEILQLSVDRG